MSKTNEKSSSGSATGNPRNKTALAPGHSLMDWIRLGSSGIDLTGVGGVSQVVSVDQLKKHNRRDDAWIAIRGVVFNVTRYMDFHPGGVEELMKGVGTDATKMFDDVHAWVNYQSILQKCVVGRLSRTSVTDLKLSPLLPTLPCFPSTSSSKDQDNVSKRIEELPEDKQQIDSDKSINLEYNWEQTSWSIFLMFKLPETVINIVPFFELNRQNSNEFNLQVFFSSFIRIFEFELTDSVNWPPFFSECSEKKDFKFTFRKTETKIWRTLGYKIESSKKRVVKDTETDLIYRKWTVIENKKICENVFQILLKIDGFMEVIPCGWHVKVKTQIESTDIYRDYTPIPIYFSKEIESLDSENKRPKPIPEDNLCLAVKYYENGTVSSFISRLSPGDTLEISRCLGTFNLEDCNIYSEIHMVVGGTGITPMLSIIFKALANRNVVKINLLNFNRNKENIFYENHLEDINRIDNRFCFTNILTQPPDDWEGCKGEISESLLKELIRSPKKHGCILTCGPPKFMQKASELLRQLSWQMSQIYSFSA